MTRTLKLALVVSLAVHAAALAVLRMVSSGESKFPVGEASPITVLVPVQEDFVVKPTKTVPAVTKTMARPIERKAEPPAAPAKIEPAQISSTAPTPPPPKAIQPEVEIPPTAPVKPPIREEPSRAAAGNESVKVAATTIPAPVAMPSRAATEAPPLITGRVKYRAAKDPDYPALARRRRQEGTVLLDVTISPKGRALSVTVKQSSSFPLLDRAAVEAANGWDFEVEPAVPVRAEIPVRFQLAR